MVWLEGATLLFPPHSTVTPRGAPKATAPSCAEPSQGLFSFSVVSLISEILLTTPPELVKMLLAADSEGLRSSS